MLSIDLSGKRAFVAGVADDGGFGFAIAKSLAEAGATICVGTWPPAMRIFTTMLGRGKFDESRKLAGGGMLEFEKIVPLDADFDVADDMSAERDVALRFGVPEDRRRHIRRLHVARFDPFGRRRARRRPCLGAAVHPRAEQVELRRVGEAGAAPHRLHLAGA